MKIIGSYIGIAPKLSGTGSIKYSLWVDDKGSLYIQFIENDASGTFSNFAFSVSQYESVRNSDKKLGQLEGYGIKDHKSKMIDDNNNGAFLKAVLNHLLDERIKK